MEAFLLEAIFLEAFLLEAFFLEAFFLVGLFLDTPMDSGGLIPLNYLVEGGLNYFFF